MAIQTQYGKLSGTVESPLLPVTVWDDTGADLSAEVAVQQAQDAAPNELFSWPQHSDPSFDQINDHAWVVSIPYRPRVPSTPTAPPAGEITVDYRMSYHAQSKYVYNALECLGVYDTAGLVAGVERLKVNVQTAGGVRRLIGMQCDPLPEVHSLAVVVPNAIVTAAYRASLDRLAGCFNISTFMGYAAGTVQLVRFDLTKRSDDDWHLSFGFGRQDVQTNVPFDGNDDGGLYAVITVPELPPYAITWTIDRDVVADWDGTIERLADVVIVQRVWDFGDFADLGLGSLS